MNQYYSKIFVISLFDKVDRWKKMEQKLKSNKIKAQRIITIDGRCKSQGRKGCIQKLKSFEILYNIKLSIPKNEDLKEVVPRTSLTLCTLQILRSQIKNKWKNVLILEDDVIFIKNFNKIFKKGIKSIINTKNNNWDLLYLGCGRKCGKNGVSFKHTNNNKYLTSWNRLYHEEYYFVDTKEDLRGPCSDCKKITKFISKPIDPSGTWAYSISLKGAKKLVKLLEKNPEMHLDHIYADNIQNKKLKALAFDPPIILHEYGAERLDSDIPW